MRDGTKEIIGEKFAAETTNLLNHIESLPEFFPLKARSFSTPAIGGANSIRGGSSGTTEYGNIASPKISAPSTYGNSASPKFIRLKTSSRSLSFRGGGGTPKGFINNDNVVALEAWIVPALTCALAYALYNISIKKASNDINPVLGGVILQFVAAILGLVIYVTTQHTNLGDAGSIDYNSVGILWSVAAGVFVGLAEILSFFVNGKGVPATQSIPVIIGGSVLFGTIFGQLFLGEDVSPKGWVGVSLITIGITIVSMQ